MLVLLLSQEALQEEVRAGAALGNTPQVHMRHFQAAINRIQPSVSGEDQRVYDALRQKLRRCVFQICLFASILSFMLTRCKMTGNLAKSHVMD